MKHVIKLELSPSSVLAAWGKLNAYKTRLSGAIDRATENLMNDAADYLNRILQIEQDPKDQRISIFAEETAGGFILTIKGQGVGFVEFGTGAYADTSHPFAGNAPFNVWSGSWSDDHERTWQAYIKYGAYADRNGEYLYNRYPVRPLYETSEWIRQHWADYLRREIEAIDIG